MPLPRLSQMEKWQRHQAKALDSVDCFGVWHIMAQGFSNSSFQGVPAESCGCGMQQMALELGCQMLMYRWRHHNKQHKPQS